MFKQLSLYNWRQYDRVDISFHPHLTVLTGANGAGKTTLLNILASNLGWTSKFVSSYEKDDTEQSSHYGNSLWYTLEQIEEIVSSNDSTVQIGELEYMDGKKAKIQIPQSVSATYGVVLSDRQPIQGLYINSHRPTFPYKPLKSVPSHTKDRKTIFSQYYDFSKNFVFDEYRDREKQTSTGLIKETLASLAMFGYGNEAVVADPKMKELFVGYEVILKKVLPPKLGFKKIKVVIPEVILCTDSGDFPIDAVSGGISSIIDITWQIFMYGGTAENFAVVIDEPENHLHPELQKNLLSNLIEAFPHVQFIIATHNPFMISAVKDSNVYVLNYNEKHKVFSTKLDHVNRAGTSNAILREVLGVDTSIPIWAEEQLKAILIEYSSKDFTQENLDLLRQNMHEIGLSDFIPDTISQIVEGIEND